LQEKAGADFELRRARIEAWIEQHHQLAGPDHSEMLKNEIDRALSAFNTAVTTLRKAQTRHATQPTTDEQACQTRQRELIAKELPDLVQRDQMRKDAQQKPTLSGELRRAIHASELSLSAIAAQAGMTPLLLDEFLTGERTLRSDVMDRLASAVGFRFQSVH
jgi:hypothetical protein